MVPPTLDYGRAGKNPRSRRQIIWGLFWTALIVFVLYGVVGGPTSGDIRIDTGDLRYRYFGIPLVYKRMREPERSQLLKLATRSTILKPEWHTCVEYPLASSNNTDSMCADFYFLAAKWIAVDPQIARMVTEDIATYVIRTKVRQGLPQCAPMLMFVDDINTGVSPQWRQDAGVIWYLHLKGYSIPSTQPTTR
jgi:hypothetical protein